MLNKQSKPAPPQEQKLNADIHEQLGSLRLTHDVIQQSIPIELKFDTFVKSRKIKLEPHQMDVLQFLYNRLIFQLYP